LFFNLALFNHLKFRPLTNLITATSLISWRGSSDWFISLEWTKIPSRLSNKRGMAKMPPNSFSNPHNPTIHLQTEIQFVSQSSNTVTAPPPYNHTHSNSFLFILYVFIYIITLFLFPLFLIYINTIATFLMSLCDTWNSHCFLSFHMLGHFPPLCYCHRVLWFCFSTFSFRI